MQALLASLPIVAILWLMLGRRQSAARAGVAGCALALALAWTAFDFGAGGGPGVGRLAATGGTALEAAFLAATIVWIVFPALCIFEAQRAAGAFDLLRRRLGRLSGDPRTLAILVAWFFGLFMEGAAGFGTPVALGAPILVSLGVQPVRAVALMLIGHAAGVSFGAIGTPILPQVAATGLDPMRLSAATALLHAVAGWVLLVFVHRLAGRGDDGRGTVGNSGGWQAWAQTGYAAICFLVPFWLIGRYVGPELPTLGGALVGAAFFVATLAVLHRRRPPAQPEFIQASGGDASSVAAGDDARSAVVAESSLARAAMPYAVLVVLVVLTRLWPQVRQALMAVSWEWSMPGGFGGRFAPLYHPGTMLAVSFVVGLLLQRAGPVALATAAVRAGRRLLPVVVALVAMLMLSRLMVHAGMIGALADLAASSAGPAWPLLAPAIGVLGTFVTGSATASNILFTDFQAATAAALGFAVLPLVAAQGFGAAVGNLICPHNIVAGGATVGIAGREGEVLGLTLPACLAYTAIGGALVAATVALGW